MELTFVHSRGNSVSAQAYTAVDAPHEKGMNYYRLKQLDIDGKATYSAIRMINFVNKQNIMIYPNPARGSFNIFVSEITVKVRYTIVSINGVQVLSGNIATGSSLTPVNVSGLAAGTLFCQNYCRR
jgi:trimeric autotransporter adhesin